ncbi:MAG TPA: prolyl oligopeptidase family serine peptidase [Arenimonas sp.]|nr:prolyl oligopeptidase family serine peptidase [Arenimonas sp.]
MTKCNPMRAISAIFLLALPLAGPLQAASAPPVETYTKTEQVQPGSFVISPTGNHIAMIAPLNDRSSLIILDRATNKVTANITPQKGQYIGGYWWVSDSRVVITLNEKEGGYDTPFSTGELIGVDADGGGKKYLFGYRGDQELGSRINRATANAASAYVLEPDADADKSILVGIQSWKSSGETTFLELARLNVISGALKKSGGRLPMRYPSATLVGEDKKVRAVAGTDGDRMSKLLYKGPKDADWAVLNDQKASGRIIEPLSNVRGSAEFYARVSESGKPDYLIRYNPESRKEQVVYQPATADIGGLMLTADLKDAYAVESFDGSGRGGFVYFNAEAPEAKLSKKLISQFPGELAAVNSYSRDGRYASVFVHSDVNPGEYYVYDRDAGKLSKSVVVRPDVDIDAAAVVEPVEFKARDGLAMRGWLTLPNAPAAKMPLVVMPHGGPYGIVDRWEFNTDAQLLASRGYAVLQINFRGSGGYGKDFLDAGLREWGGKMQTDITDGTRAALAKYAIDPSKVCIFGASYGAYAALMAVATEPGLYKCAVGYAGVYNLGLIRNETALQNTAFGRDFVNDVFKNDAAWLRARSPSSLAGQIKAPVMLIHGGEDFTAPVEHAEAMRTALNGVGNPPAWVFESTEGHGFFDPKKRLNAYQQMVDFMDKHIGPK